MKFFLLAFLFGIVTVGSVTTGGVTETVQPTPLTDASPLTLEMPRKINQRGLFGHLQTSLIEKDEIKELPGVDFDINFKQYSGYLDGLHDRKHFYWFAESEKSPADDPVVVWFTGGPGCSSLTALLTEIGPFRASHENPGKLSLVEHRWNKIANILFLETPAGTGFSFRENGNVKTDDDQEAENNHEVIKSFFKKFPHLKSNKFFLTGESYGAVYIATLGTRLLQDSDINFQGYAIGNGMLDREMSVDSQILFAYHHGLLGKKTWTTLIESCCKNGGNVTSNHPLLIDPLSKPKSCDFANQSHSCRTVTRAARDAIVFSGLNIYNLYAKCQTPSGNLNLRTLNQMSKRRHSRDWYDRQIFAIGEENGQHEQGRVVKKLKKATSQTNNSPCLDDSHTEFYMNQESVRDALHVSPNVKEWTACSDDIAFTYGKKYKTVKSQILELIKAEKRGLIYGGDVDFVCPLLMNQWFVDDLELPVKSEYQAWRLEGQIAGFSQTFENLVFATVKGGGHMAPEDKPAEVFHLFENFLNGH